MEKITASEKGISHRVSNGLAKGYGIFFMGVFFLLFVNCIFFNLDHKWYFIWWVQLLAFLGVGSVLLGCGIGCEALYRHCKLIKFVFAKYPVLMIFAVMLVVFVAQVWYAKQIGCIIGWDCGFLVNSSAENHPDSVYYSRYPNNIFLMFVFRWINSLHIGDLWSVVRVVNILCVDLSILLVFVAGKIIFGLRTGLVSWALALVTMGFWGWLIVPYSDTVSMPFSIAAFCLYLYGRNTKWNLCWKITAMAGVGILIYIGYSIKPTAIIVGIAIVLAEIVKAVKNRKNFKKIAVFLGTIIMFAGVSHIGWSAFLNHQDVIKLDPDRAFPMSHFFMMGMNKKVSNNYPDRYLYGAFLADDVDYTDSFQGHDAKVEANLVRIKQRFSQYGVWGYLQFLIQKLRWITSDGTFAWGVEGNFLFSYSLEKGSESAVFLKNLIYPKGQNFNYYRYFAQGIWLFLLLLITFPLFTKQRVDHRTMLFAIRLTVTGIVLFVLLFEGRARYLINHLPYFILLAGYGFTLLESKVGKRCFRKISRL